MQTDEFYYSPLTLEVTSTSSKAKAWVLSGLCMSYCFNHDESVACFKRAIEKDSNCALAYWGVSYALGINYNETLISEVCGCKLTQQLSD
jgi:hypothetical protein